MNLQQLRAAVRELLQEPDEHGRFTNEALNRWINDGILDVVDRIECLVTTVSLPFEARTGAMLLPADFLKVRRVSINGRRILPTTDLLVDREIAVRRLNSADQHGTPTHFYLVGRMLHLYPVPASDVTVNLTYVQAPPALVQDEDVSPLPTWMNPLVVQHAAASAWKSDNDARWVQQLQEYETKIATARRRWNERQPTGTFRIRLGR